MNPLIAVLDHGSGNVHSVVRALEHAGARTVLTSSRTDIAEADGLLVPGVGAFVSVMDALKDCGGDVVIRERVAQKRPLFGVCVGMQVLFAQGTEHGDQAKGLAVWPGSITRLNAPIVPHMGWSQVRPAAGSAMFAGIESEHFYFVHSYAASTPVPGVLNTVCDYGQGFVAAIEDGPIWATQFHPEKSSSAGAQILKNWLDHIQHS